MFGKAVCRPFLVCRDCFAVPFGDSFTDQLKRIGIRQMASTSTIDFSTHSVTSADAVQGIFRSRLVKPWFLETCPSIAFHKSGDIVEFAPPETVPICGSRSKLAIH